MKTHPLQNTLAPPRIVQGHVVCRSCGRAADVAGMTADPTCLSAADDHGFVVVETEVFYRGLCRDCLS